jgi:LPS sulfotransferase NodH
VITIVSGLPRSGTSLMMQMLAAGGMPILSDGERMADTDNPRGYCEWERIKQLPKEPTCIDEAEGKAVKVISQLLFALPAGRSYQIIFMERPLPEVVASQAEMIRRRGTAGAPLPEAALIAGLRAHLNQVNAWLSQTHDILVSRVEYHSVLRDPRAAAGSVQEFLQRALDVEAMARQVDPSLYRQRTQEAGAEKSGRG